MPEIILVGAICWCFAIVFAGASFDSITETLFGVQLHLNVGSGMGALIAGATIASHPYSTEIVTKVGVVKDFFVTLFFVGLGLGIPEPSGPAVLLLAVAIAIAAIAARQLILFPLLYFNGLDQRNAEVTAVRIAQISEFSLVIAFLGTDLGHLSKDLSSAIIFAFVLTAIAHHAALPLRLQDPRAAGADAACARLQGSAGGCRRARRRRPTASPSSASTASPRRSSTISPATIPISPARRWSSTSTSPCTTASAQVGAHVKYGDLANPETLHHAGVDKAEVVVLTVPDDLLRGTDNRKLVENVRRINPQAMIIANAVSFPDCQAIYEAGANYVFLSRLDTARELGKAIGEALNGNLAPYRTARESEDGKPATRQEVLR